MNRVSVVLRDTDDVAGLATFTKLISRQSWADDVEIIWLTKRGKATRLRSSGKFSIRSLSLEPDLLASSEALNQGCSMATGQCVIFTDGHTQPLSDTWIDSAV